MIIRQDSIASRYTFTVTDGGMQEDSLAHGGSTPPCHSRASTPTPNPLLTVNRRVAQFILWYIPAFMETLQ